MEVKKNIIIEVSGEDAENLKSGLKEIATEMAKVGLRNNDITPEEAKIINELNKSLNG